MNVCKKPARRLLDCALKSTLLIFLILIDATVAFAQTSEESNRVGNAILAVQKYHDDTRHMPRQVDALRKEHDLYFHMAAQMELPGDLAHLEIAEADSGLGWAVNASRIRTAIKPGVYYDVPKGRGSVCICGSEEVTSRLCKNVRYITWYREQLDRSFGSERANQAAVSVASLIDEYLQRLADAVPRVKIRLTGELNVDGRQKLEYSDSEIWGIVSALNRYFFYKFQLNPGRTDFHQADFMLIESMVKTAAIFGSRPPTTGIQKVAVELTASDQGWQKAAYDAIKSWEDFQAAPSESEAVICVIRIPSKPEQAAAPVQPVDPNQFPDDVEDVKELGGKIFLKRDGRWTPWEGS